MLNRDAPMADLLNRGMVVVLAGLLAGAIFYFHILEWRSLLGSPEQFVKLAEQSPLSIAVTMIGIGAMARWLRPQWLAVMALGTGCVGIVYLLILGIRIYALTKGFEALHWDYWLALVLMAGLCVVAPVGHWLKPKDKVVSGAPKKTRFWSFVPVLLMIVSGGFGLWGMVRGDPDASRFGVYAMFFGFQALLPQFDKYPALRIAAVILAIAVALIGLAFFVMEGGIGAIVRHWDVTLMVAYLPLMGLAWFGYTRFKEGKGRYDN